MRNPSAWAMTMPTPPMPTRTRLSTSEMSSLRLDFTEHLLRCHCNLGRATLFYHAGHELEISLPCLVAELSYISPQNYAAYQYWRLLRNLSYIRSNERA